MIFLNVLPRRTLHSRSSTIDSYGDYLFAITMDIYHELGEFPSKCENEDLGGLEWGKMLDESKRSFINTIRIELY